LKYSSSSATFILVIPSSDKVLVNIVHKSINLSHSYSSSSTTFILVIPSSDKVLVNIVHKSINLSQIHKGMTNIKVIELDEYFKFYVDFFI
jgi:hypothetical protein